LSAILLLAPGIPMLFMGEEHGAIEPFRYFVDFQGPLGQAVRDGRRNEFAKFADFADPARREQIPDPVDPATFHASAIDWRRQSEPAHRDWLEHHGALLRIRQTEIAPRLAGATAGSFALPRPNLLRVDWPVGDGVLRLIAWLSRDALEGIDLQMTGRQLWPLSSTGGHLTRLPPWYVGWYLDASDGR
jgi:maltooligosyltrehalose trehalohydrolase